MRRREMLRRAGAALTVPVLLGSAATYRPARAAMEAEPVDVELVLAVDVSRSVDPREMELQFNGYAAAFRDPRLMAAVAAGPIGAIGCTVFVWSDPDEQRVLVPWTRIDGAKSGEEFAAAIDHAPRHGGAYTSISAAIDFALKMFDASPFEGTRRVVDISGDGANNSSGPGRTLEKVREDAFERGIVLNGLAILDRPDPNAAAALPERYRQPLDEYYRESVIGGPGSFLVVADGFEAFGNAVRRKLIREIANLRHGLPQVEWVYAA